MVTNMVGTVLLRDMHLELILETWSNKARILASINPL